ncbi:MAG TPA: bifunctional precorrin-2 dehydrogenase/sirohydrochlorin ferrochelatase [Candidatus Binatia bacterium]|nr:bifunctional precorrin-2 dehydrogenase/sirohydrochlorin ferrochelatase [Candidatus Binatia bacterium]
MRAHPVSLCLEGRPCVVVGGDPVAEAKTVALLRAGARVTLVSAELPAGLAGHVQAGTVRHLARGYRPGDLREAFLAYAVVEDPDVIARLRAEAERERVLLNVADRPEACTFLSPAVVERGNLQVAVGTGGASPGLAAALRRELEGRFGPEYGPFVAILDAVRTALARGPRRGDVLAALLVSPLLDLIRGNRLDEIDRLLAAVVGEGCTLGRLGVRLEGSA